jgi:hypothetical protein
VLLQNPYIAKSVKLEQFIMEGSYNKVSVVGTGKKSISSSCFWRPGSYGRELQRHE